MKRKRSKKNEQSAMWTCPTCLAQMVGGVRCLQHNPTPEERAQHPEMYQRAKLAPHVSSRTVDD